MAIRPIFIPNIINNNFVLEEDISFEWYPGFSISQKRKSIKSLHNSASKKGIEPVLEISTKSEEILGRKLSAFNLSITTNNSNINNITVESAYQGSKVFENGGPFKDLFYKSGREIKKDERLYESGKLVAFEFMGERWPLEPITAFYDWLYINALNQNKDKSKNLLKYKGFTDIEFNPKKSFSCQARSAALFVSLKSRELLEKALRGKDEFLLILKPYEYDISEKYSNVVQEEIFPDYPKQKKSKKRKRRIT